MTSRAGAFSTVTRAARPGTTRTATRSRSRLPSTVATTVTGIVVVAPPTTSPVQSTRPSNDPPPGRKTTVAFGTTLPARSLTSAVSCTGSPTAISAFPGRTTMRASGGSAGVCCCCWRAATNKKESAITRASVFSCGRRRLVAFELAIGEFDDREHSAEEEDDGDEEADEPCAHVARTRRGHGFYATL